MKLAVRIKILDSQLQYCEHYANDDGLKILLELGPDLYIDGNPHALLASKN